MKNFFSKILKFFDKIHPATRNIKYKTIDFALCNKSIMANRQASFNQFGTISMTD